MRDFLHQVCTGLASLAAAGSVSVVLPGDGAQAADQGSLGQVSKGSINFSVSVASRAGATRIDKSLESSAGQSTAASRNVRQTCFWVASATRSITLVANGRDVDRGATAQLDGQVRSYRMSWVVSGGEGARALEVLPGKPLHGLEVAASSVQCLETPRFLLEIAAFPVERPAEPELQAGSESIDLVIRPE